jgi:hypothetical protein
MGEQTESKVFAVQMVEYNPRAGNLRKGLTVSGVGAFHAGNAVPGTPFVPSPIVPIPDPDRPVAVGMRSVPLFDLLTGQDPAQPGTFWLHQPNKPGLPVFRRIVAPDMPALHRAVEIQAQQAAQSGRPAVPARIIGQIPSEARAAAPEPQSVEQILEGGLNATAPVADAHAGPTRPDIAALLADIGERKLSARGAIAKLDAALSLVTDDDLKAVVEGGQKLLREWAQARQDERAALTAGA